MSCKLCWFERKTVTHILKDCWWMKSIWRGVGLDMELLEYEFDSFADWIFFLDAKLDADRLGLACCSFWFVCFNRNVVWHDNLAGRCRQRY